MEQPRVIGRYALHDKISSGGMATVYYGRLIGPVGFSRTVAIKQLHPQYSRDPDFVSMFVDEARLAAKIRHPHVVPVLDVVHAAREIYLVMDYVLGASLAELIGTCARSDTPIPTPIVTAVIGGCLHGLHAAHETRDDRGEPLDIVHRDVSPANILVGRDGLARVLDFGIAKAAGRAQITRHGELKGKLGYMAPEQLRGGQVDKRADVYAVAVTLWETLTRRRAFRGDHDEVMRQRRSAVPIPPPSSIDPKLVELDDLCARGLAQDPDERFASAREMAAALEQICAPASIGDVSAWLEDVAAPLLTRRETTLATLERDASPTQVRAAIRHEVGVDVAGSEDALATEDPDISVTPWTDPSIDLGSLDSEEQLAVLASAQEATTVEMPAMRRALGEGRALGEEGAATSYDRPKASVPLSLHNPVDAIPSALAAAVVTPSADEVTLTEPSLRRDGDAALPQPDLPTVETVIPDEDVTLQESSPESQRYDPPWVTMDTGSVDGAQASTASGGAPGRAPWLGYAIAAAVVVLIAGVVGVGVATTDDAESTDVPSPAASDGEPVARDHVIGAIVDAKENAPAQPQSNQGADGDDPAVLVDQEDGASPNPDASGHEADTPAAKSTTPKPGARPQPAVAPGGTPFDDLGGRH